MSSINNPPPKKKKPKKGEKEMEIHKIEVREKP